MSPFNLSQTVKARDLYFLNNIQRFNTQYVVVRFGSLKKQIDENLILETLEQA